jgi:hypothetical protein
MVPHCFYCRYNGTQDWDTANNRCKGLEHGDDDGQPQPCRDTYEGETPYRHFMAADEPNAEDALDRLLPEFDKLKWRVDRMEIALRCFAGKAR